MKKVFILILILQFIFLCVSAEEIDKWGDLKYLEGTWQMKKPGVENTQTYSFFFHNKFLKMKTKVVFAQTEKNPKGEIHEDMGIFSYDAMKKKLVLRSFHIEGFVNQYILSERSKDGKVLTFTTELVENAPPGTKAKLIFEKINDKEFAQKFFVAWPNKGYSCFSDNHFKKIN
jgi:hypothetical protein